MRFFKGLFYEKIRFFFILVLITLTAQRIGLRGDYFPMVSDRMLRRVISQLVKKFETISNEACQKGDEWLFCSQKRKD